VTLLVIALLAGGLALLRYLAGLAMLVRYLRRASVSGLPKGPTPPLTLLKPGYGRDPDLRENLVTTLRQNHPLFEVL